MSGVVFVVCIPTTNYEQVLKYGVDALQSNDDDLLNLEINLRGKKHQTIPITLNGSYRSNFSDRQMSISTISNKDNIAPMEKVYFKK
jgi:hypothetical protein